MSNFISSTHDKMQDHSCKIHEIILFWLSKELARTILRVETGWLAVAAESWARSFSGKYKQKQDMFSRNAKSEVKNPPKSWTLSAFT